MQITRRAYVSLMQITRRAYVSALGGAATSRTLAFGAQISSKSTRSPLSMPGLYRGRVVAVEDATSIIAGTYQAEPIREMMRRGMAELTGRTWAEAWRQFVQPGDVVGIKVNPVGQASGVISGPEVMHEIIGGLNSAGIKNRDIVVYDRYRKQFFDGGFDKWLPDGVRTSYAAEDYDPIQQDMQGYDPDHYMDMPLVRPGYDTGDAHARRSYASRFITTEVNKLINLAVLKDHQSAGVTLCLKNLSHGLVNNVSRSHISGSVNVCGAFIPAVVSLPVIRDKAVLHILDGIKGLYHGGPSGKPQFVWEHRTLYFGTDPVALDHVGLNAIDAKRVAAGMKRTIDDTPDQFDTFVHKQPEHIELAGALGLGEYDETKIDLRKIRI
jgi:uncharacterized protein (DUF362 family)